MLSLEERLNISKKIMEDFAQLTGLTSDEHQERYLWTDSFAIFNFISLYALTCEERFKKLALLLVDKVHHILGRHRGDNGRSGWISGLSNEEAKEHPTIGGLRIGKRLPERKPDEPYDPILEWERDGQYYHYLTKWMLALCRVYQVTMNPKYLRWSIELAKTAHKAFVHTSDIDGRKHIYWKMSIDLSRPLVPQEGQHDALDGLVTYAELQLTVQRASLSMPHLNDEVKDLLEMCKERDWSEWVTDDPLGLGELLCATYRLARLAISGMNKLIDIMNSTLEASYVSLRILLPRAIIYLPATSRLAFRELGLAIGLQAFQRLKDISKDMPVNKSRVEAILNHASLADKIQEYWLNPKNQETYNWSLHRNINMVMLVTSLLPDGYLGTSLNNVE